MFPVYLFLKIYFLFLVGFGGDNSVESMPLGDV